MEAILAPLRNAMDWLLGRRHDKDIHRRLRRC